MLIANNLKDIMLELLSLNEIGCTYDFKERFNVGLNSLEVLGLVKVIRTKIPICGDHCQRYNDCEWIPIFEKKKSKSKFKFTKDGLRLLEELSSEEITDSKVDEILQNYLMSIGIIDLILSMLMDNQFITMERLTSTLLKKTNLTLYVIRITTKDILDLMVRLNFITVTEGQIIKNA
ncbi:MAG: hypothetical protein HZR80_14305 [Candidatus Heimdallarchaeota archaeon]